MTEHILPEPDQTGDRNLPLAILRSEWEALEDTAMSLRGIVTLLENGDFQASNGAEELLRLVYRQYEHQLSVIRDRLFGDD